MIGILEVSNPIIDTMEHPSYMQDVLYRSGFTEAVAVVIDGAVHIPMEINREPNIWF